MKFGRPLRAVLLDVDGTLYQQRVLRAFMALELCTLPLINFSYQSTANVWKILVTFRRVREELREMGAPPESLGQLQYIHTAQRMDIDTTAVAEAVSEWLFRRPLKYLRLCRRNGIEAFFSFLENNNLYIGLFSDYPAGEKLAAMKLAGSKIWPVLCATDAQVNAFKPHPKGFLRASELWGLAPDEVLYIGDRFEVDAAGAAAAGMPCAIISDGRRKKVAPRFGNCFVVFSFSELQHVLIDNIER
jgi:phosphoglycolate phosphatase/putative hydrolase of the HAD superfamily